MKKFNRRRWSDNDHNFGPFTFARDLTYKSWAIVLSSAEEEDCCKLRISAFHCTFIIVLPDWILRPLRKKVYPSSWTADDVARIGRNWYWDLTRRDYGISYNEGFLQIMYGRQTDSSDTEQRWGCFLPWTQWRHVRRSLYRLDGSLFADIPDGRWGTAAYDQSQILEDACPTMSFIFKDYDGEELSAKTKIEEREWKFGTGWFKWLSWFRKPKIRRDLDIKFSGETGRRKGSWKGGTVGHGIYIEYGELHEDAFKHYCAEHDMKFICVAPWSIQF